MPIEKKTHFQQAFIRYNDTQDKHRGQTTWRQLLPELEEALQSQQTNIQYCNENI